MEQRAHLELAHRKVMEGYDAFVEIMSGPNPLSAAEIRKLAAKRPAIYGKYLKYAERMEAEQAK